jgi:hypothetical protein
MSKVHGAATESLYHAQQTSAGGGTALFQLLPTNSSLSAYEYPTLAALHALCRRRPEALVLYLHNKGASRGGEKQRAARAWRHYMEHFVLRRHAACLGVLAAGYDTCGVQWAEDWSMYGGNMW